MAPTASVALSAARAFAARLTLWYLSSLSPSSALIRQGIELLSLKEMIACRMVWLSKSLKRSQSGCTATGSPIFCSCLMASLACSGSRSFLIQVLGSFGSLQPGSKSRIPTSDHQQLCHNGPPANGFGEQTIVRANLRPSRVNEMSGNSRSLGCNAPLGIGGGDGGGRSGCAAAQRDGSAASLAGRGPWQGGRRVGGAAAAAGPWDASWRGRPRPA